MAINEMFIRDFMFEDRETGEVFFVETDSAVEARRIAKENFQSPHLIDICSVEEAEILGYDTY